MEKISSLDNEKVKLVASLKEKKYRDKYGLFVGEGIRFLEMAKNNSDFEIVSVFFEEKILKNDRAKTLLENLGKNQIYNVPEKIMQKISNTKTPQGILAVIKQKKYSLNEFTFNGKAMREKNFFAVLDGVQDPGNVGTIIRLADAVGLDAVILTKNSVDIYSDKVIRATMGSIFNIPVIRNVLANDIANFAKEKNLKIYASVMNATVCYEKDLSSGGIFVFGSESDGVSREILSISENISLPIVGGAESLNVASAASAVLYEAYRQSYY